MSQQQIVMLLGIISFALGVVSAAVKSGKILGQWDWPAKWSPWAMLVVSFGVGFVGALQQGSDVVTALLAGLGSLGAGVMGASAHLHVSEPPAPPSPPAVAS